MDRSITEYFYSPGEPKGHKCGYCKSPDLNTSVSQGMWTHRLTVEDYQDLVDRGWRRSGKYCYKPLMPKTCCPLYTISCLATKFRLSNSQKAVLKKMNKYLISGDSNKQRTTPSPEINKDGANCTDATVDCAGVSVNTAGVKKAVQPGKGADASKPPCRKAKVVRQEMRKKKLSSRVAASTSGSGKETVATGTSQGGKSTDPVPDFVKVSPDSRKPLEAFLTSTPDKPGAHKLELKLVRSHPPSVEFKETFAESYSLFKKYQMSVHKEAAEDCEESNFRNFLCDSPLIAKKGREGWPCDYGSYHQHYRIDGKLVAVGVIDILPKCMSSVYVYYDTDRDFLNLGVYSALRELEMTRKLHLCDPERFKYYYMGYYVHSCQKMRYKGNYTPSFLLCPESYKFEPIESCLPKLEASKYSRLNDEKSVEENVRDWLGSTLVLVKQTILTYIQFSQFVSDGQEDKLKQYAELVGPKVASRMLLVLDSE